jgi:cyclophilin family peptidyl-prolyl cis-trans isomerase
MEVTMRRTGKHWMSRVAFGMALALAGAAHGQCRTLVRFTTDLGTFDVSLLDQDAPITVANFLRYVDDGRYNGTFMHRLVPGFVVQGGGWSYRNSSGLAAVATYPPIVNEFSIAHGNVARTMAMAKLSGNPNSATSQFFINLVDNSPNLNVQNGGFTVFGEIVAGWSVVQAIEQLTIANYSSTNTALGTVPVRAAAQPIAEEVLVNVSVAVIERCGCYVNCDASTRAPVLNVADFICFLSRYAAGSAYANCDGSTAAPTLTASDFMCFMDRYASGCP